jgi:hypothetical protein
MLKGQAYDDVNAAIGTIDSSNMSNISNMSSRHGAIMPYGRLSGITASFVLFPWHDRPALHVHRPRGPVRCARLSLTQK